MSKLIGFAESSITNPKFTMERQADGFFWYTVTPGWEVYNASHVAGYGITATEDSPGRYSVDNPDPDTAASFRLVAAAGANLAVSDLTNNANVRGIGEVSPGLTEIDSSVLTSGACNKIADHVRRRTQANVEASSDGDALSKNSMYGYIQQGQKSVTNNTTWTVYKTDGITVLGTFTLTASASADPTTGVS